MSVSIKKFKYGNNKKCKQYQTFIYAVCIILIIFFLFWFGIDHFISDLQERGTFGDKFGAVNSLFSGLAFAGLIYTIYLQQEELRLQREELRQTREEMARQTREFDEQNRKYIAMLRGQLSRYELIWLYYNGLSDMGSEILKPLIEKYAMLKNVRQELIVDTDQYVGEYSPSAFGKES